MKEFVVKRYISTKSHVMLLFMAVAYLSCPVIIGGVVPVEYSLARWNRALYFQIVCGAFETEVGHIRQWIGTLVHGLDLENFAAAWYCI